MSCGHYTARASSSSIGVHSQRCASTSCLNDRSFSPFLTTLHANLAQHVPGRQPCRPVVRMKLDQAWLWGRTRSVPTAEKRQLRSTFGSEASVRRKREFAACAPLSPPALPLAPALQTGTAGHLRQLYHMHGGRGRRLLSNRMANPISTALSTSMHVNCRQGEPSRRSRAVTLCWRMARCE